MELTFLGTGTSQGVPCIGCECEVCRSDDPRDKRTRPSVLVRLAGGEMVLIDTTPELRVQSLAVGLKRVDTVLITHGHADHVMGMDDLRSFNEINGNVIPCYGAADTLKRLEIVFDYAAVPPGEDRRPACPGVHFLPVSGPVILFGHKVTPLPLIHNSRPIIGWRFDAPDGASLAYCTDVSEIPEDTFRMMQGLDLLVLGALRHRPHVAHMNLEQALAAASRIAATRTYFTHMNHELPHAATNAALPPDKQLSYDGLTVRVGA